MFAEHQPQIAAFARRSPENFARVLAFAMLSAHTQFSNVAATLDDGPENDYRNRNVVFAWKAVAWRLILDQAHEHFRILETSWRAYECDHTSPRVRANRRRQWSDYALAHLARRVYGLGFVKAGFVLQMAYGVSGCLDTHNIRQFRVKRGILAKPGRDAMPKTWARKARAYNDAIARCGGTHKLWDVWCDGMAERYQKTWRCGAAVSAEHLAIIPEKD